MSRAGGLAQRLLRVAEARASKRRQSDVALGDRIEALHRASTEAYGRPRIQADLRDEKVFVSDKRVAKLMRERIIQGAAAQSASAGNDR